MRASVLSAAFAGLCTIACADVLFTDSFEGQSRVKWQNSWGPVTVTEEFAQDGKSALKETLEDKYGLSVRFVALDVYPKTAYRASAWVFVPKQEKAARPCLAFARPSWAAVAAATTDKQDEWVKLEVECRDVPERQINLVLYQDGQAAGLGGSVMYWDNVTVEREMGEIKLDDGIRINPYVLEGLDVTPAGGMKLKVAPGKVDIDGVVVEIKEETVLELSPPRVIQVRDEQAKLSDQVPQSYHGGTALQKVTIEGIGLADSLAPESLVVKAEPGPDGRRLQEGKDWRADKAWGRVGRLPEGETGPDTTVFMDYDYGLLRMDTLEVRSDGKLLLRSGAEDKTTPAPPQADQFARALCNVFLPYHCTEITQDLIYPIGLPFPSASQAEMDRNAALIPKTLEKLEAGGDFTLLFWGDSVTCGGSASSQEKAFPLSFTNWLCCKYPQANIRYVNAGTGGWNSDLKLPLFEEEVIAKKPDLVVIEFVNDMGMDRDRIFKNYTEAIGRIRASGGEAIILTPHFVRPAWMGAAGMRTPETRASVGFLKEYAAENKVGLADASRRWEHLWIEGIPYITFEYNAINHPDDRGHALFVEELQKFFP